MSASAEQHLLVFLILITYKFIRLRRFVGRHNSNNDIKILFCFIFFLLNNLKNIDVPLILVSTLKSELIFPAAFKHLERCFIKRGPGY